MFRVGRSQWRERADAACMPADVERMSVSVEPVDHAAEFRDPSDLAALVEKAAAGDRLAFERLVDSYHGRIFSMVYYRIMSRMDAEDITQDVFVKAFGGIGSLKNPELFRPWLYRIALNAVNDFLRKKRLRSIFTVFTREQEDAGVAERRTGPDYLERKEFWDSLSKFLSRISASEREVFRQRFLDGLSIREISQVMGKNESTIKTHLYRAVEKFRRETELSMLLQEEMP